jgi:hypothetical protein
LFAEIEDKDIALYAFGLQDIKPTKSCSPNDIDEHEEWEFKIGKDIIKFTWELEDIIDDCLKVEINDRIVYLTWQIDGSKIEYKNKTAEAIMKLIKRGVNMGEEGGG